MGEVRVVIGSKASIYKVTSLPPTGNPDSIYFLKLPNEEIAEIYITDINGAFTPSGNKQFVQEVFDSMSSYLVKTDDERLINAREWLADVVSKSDAELGISSERFVWTALRDRQATEYHFNDVSSGFGRLLLKSASAASVRNELQLGNTVTHNYGTTSGTVMQGDDSRVLNAVGRGELDSRLNSKVDKEGGKSLTDENFTLSEKQKLASLESSRWRGLFVSIAALPITATAGDYADVDSGASADIQRFIWDNSDSKWVAQSGVVPPITGAQVKALYEAQPDTNAFTDAEKSKLSGVALNATKNATDGQLRDRATHTGVQPISTVTGLQAGLDSKVAIVTGKDLSDENYTLVEKNKLEGVAVGSTKNSTDAQLRARSTHTGTQPVATITGLGNTATHNYGTVASTIAQGNDSRINNGQTAFGWGNHASAGYIKSYVDTTYTASTGLDLTGTAFSVKYGTAAGTAVQGNDSRVVNAVSTATYNAGIATKVDKVDGKELSTNDFTTVLKTKLENMDSGTGIELGEHIGSGGTSHALATTTVAGFMSGADKTKLDGVATGATANATNAQLRDRSTHTGTQAVSTIAGFNDAVISAGEGTYIKRNATTPVAANGLEYLAGFTESNNRGIRLGIGGLQNIRLNNSGLGSMWGVAMHMNAIYRPVDGVYGYTAENQYIPLVSFEVRNGAALLKTHPATGGNGWSHVPQENMNVQTLWTSSNQLNIGTTPASARAALQIPDSVALKTFIGTAVSNASGEFTINWSSAGFTAPPQHVTVTAYNTDGVVTNRVWATMKAKALQTATQGQGYTLKGNNLVGGYSNLSVPNQTNNAGVVAAPFITVTVMAWGN